MRGKRKNYTLRRRKMRRALASHTELTRLGRGVHHRGYGSGMSRGEDAPRPEHSYGED